MKFHINQIHLWLKNSSKKRVLTFLPNKVNVITGNSGTGKSSIITIIDYCLLGSESKLVEEVINVNTLWYGLHFSINEKAFFIARKQMIGQVTSDEVYFSSTGEVPELPQSSITISDLRKILEYEFGINSNLTIPYGGKKLQAGSKVSYRYFLLFNTQSSSIILNQNVFFDYDLYDSDKYKEALDRIFDLAIGVDTVSNVVIRDKLSQIEKEIIKIEKRKKISEREISEFSKRIVELLQSAQEYDLIEKRLFTVEEGVARLNSLISDYREEKISMDLSELDKLYTDRRNVGRQIRNLRSFESEYSTYKENMENDLDSLQPIENINNFSKDLITIPEIKSFIEGLREELSIIKKDLENKKPFSTDIQKDISFKEKEFADLSNKIKQYPIQTKNFDSSIGKFIFIGELKAKLAFYSQEWENDDTLMEIADLQLEYDDLSAKLQDNDERRAILIELLQQRIQNYISNAEAIGNYRTFKAYLNQRKKILQLREPNSSNPSNIGSSSNHMFLHLFLFLGLHEHFIREKVAFIPQFLILDQLSQPYYEEAKKSGKDTIEDNDDKTKLTQAFRLLNNFIDLVTEDLKNEFQIILLEHAPKEYWEKNQMKNFHLVEEFRNGNALII